MSVAQVKKALHDFAVKGSGSAVVLKGDWGTGKTHLWDTILKEKGSTFLRTHYSYVSLFGINSLTDLKRSIFENTVPSSKVGSENSVLDNLQRLDFSDGASWLKKVLRQGKEAKIPFVGSVGGIVDSIQYSMISNTLICIDDFERRGNSLSARDVLGLISNLVEKKDCSVILILNDSSLKPDDEFFSYSEKVFDYEVKYSPSEHESVKLIFGSAGKMREFLVENIVKLKINNIRLLKKIELFASVLDEVLKEAHSKVVYQAHNTLPLAVMAVYGGGKCKVDIDFILSYQGSLLSYMPDNAGASAEELERKNIIREKSTYLDEYGFGRCDEFDALIIDLVCKGYADDETLRELVEGAEKKIKHDDDIALLGKAWELFHASFSDNESEVYTAFEFAISEALQHFTVNDLDSVASIYCDLGKERFINTVVDKYFSEFFSAKGVREKDDIFQWPRNAYLSLKLNQYFDSLAVTGDLSELVLAVVKGSGFPDGDLRRGIAQKKDDDFYEYFSSLNSKDLTRHARALLKCGEVSSPEKDIMDDFRIIFMKTYTALLKLSELTPLNRVRMNKFRNYDDVYKELASRESDKDR